MPSQFALIAEKFAADSGLLDLIDAAVAQQLWIKTADDAPVDAAPDIAKAERPSLAMRGAKLYGDYLGARGAYGFVRGAAANIAPKTPIPATQLGTVGSGVRDVVGGLRTGLGELTPKLPRPGLGPAAQRLGERLGGATARKLLPSAATKAAPAVASGEGVVANSFPANLPATARALTGEGSLARQAVRGAGNVVKSPAFGTAMNVAGAADIGHRIGTATLAPGTTAGDYWASTKPAQSVAKSSTGLLGKSQNFSDYAQSKANLADKGFQALHAGVDTAGPAASFGLKYNPVTGPFTAAAHPGKAFEEAKAVPGQTWDAVKNFGGRVADLGRAGMEDVGSEARAITGAATDAAAPKQTLGPGRPSFNPSKFKPNTPGATK